MYGNGGGGQGRLNQNALFNALKSTIAITKEESNKLFAQIDRRKAGYITFGKKITLNISQSHKLIIIVFIIYRTISFTSINHPKV